MTNTLPVWDITSEFVDAIQVWSEFLTDKRTNQEWGVAGAKVFLASEGFAIPTEPISGADLVALRALAQEAGRMRGPNPTVKRGMMPAVNKAVAQIGQWFSDNLNIQLDSNAAPSSTPSTSTLSDAMVIAKSTYADPQSELAGFTTGLGTVNNNYDIITPKIDISTLPQSEYDVVDGLIGNNAEAVYWTPPPPETELCQNAGI